MNNIAQEYYTSRLEMLRDELKGFEKMRSRLYILRVVIFMLFAASLVLAFSGDVNYIFLVAAPLLMALFISAIVRDLKNSAKIEESLGRINFIEGELNSLEYKFSQREWGAEFAELNSHLSGDFDIFSAGGLYQYLNRSVTHRGRARFAASLVGCELRGEKIERRAAAIKELSQCKDFVESFAVVGSQIKESGSEVQNLLLWIKEQSTAPRSLSLLRVALPAITLPLLALSIAGVIPSGAVTMPILISLLVVYLNAKRVNQAHALLNRSSKIFDKYSSLISLAEQQEFSAELLCEIKEKLRGGESSASRSIATLKGLLDRFDYRNNIYVSVVLNAILLFDIQTYIALLRWKREHRDCVERWFDAITELDSLLGFALYAYNCQDSTLYAEISHEHFELSAQQMGHPLINPAVRVNNSIEVGGRPAVVIITGANMAGKSTFMRTVAVNLILGMNGAPIPAESFRFSPVKILSSIKIQDSLKNRESYFYAELLRLSHILESAEQQSQAIIILDEILRGTNTKDKQLGSSGLLRKIIEKRGVAMIATHDLAIGKLEDEFPESVSNYCFEVEITGDQLSFDYRLKRGISSKLNASFLMRQMGIID